MPLRVTSALDRGRPMLQERCQPTAGDVKNDSYRLAMISASSGWLVPVGRPFFRCPGDKPSKIRTSENLDSTSIQHSRLSKQGRYGPVKEVSEYSK